LIRYYAGKGTLCILYHEFPWETNTHARTAAQYCEAAGKLGQQKLLAVMDALFTDQDVWGKDGNIPRTLAKVLSAQEIEKLRQMLDDPSVLQAIDKGVELGKKRQVTQTPTSVLYYRNGKTQVFSGALPYDVLRTYLSAIGG
jgi:protein-disulfide isomerase